MTIATVIKENMLQLAITVGDSSFTFVVNEIFSLFGSKSRPRFMF